MWRIVDHTKGRTPVVLQEHWNHRVVNEALERSHDFGVAMDIAHELVYLGFELDRDFDIGPVGVNAIPTPGGI
jgi:hypothetical protein